MLVNLVPEFLAILAAPDPVAAYHEYLERHRPILTSYWHNYVLDPDSPHAEQVIAAALRADRADLHRLLEDVDVVTIADEALRRALDRLEADGPVDLYLMGGVAAANAGGHGASFGAAASSTRSGDELPAPSWSSGAWGCGSAISRGARAPRPGSRGGRCCPSGRGTTSACVSWSRTSPKRASHRPSGRPRPSFRGRTSARWGCRRHEPEAAGGAAHQPAAARGAGRPAGPRAGRRAARQSHDVSRVGLRAAAARAAGPRSVAHGDGRRATTVSAGRNAFKVSVTNDNIVFASAHFIIFPGHRCERLHGHNYRTRVVVEGGLDPEAHYVFDFAELKHLMRRLTDELDHRVLLPLEHPKLQVREQGDTVAVAYEGKARYVFPKADCALLPIPNTTVEMLARYLARRARSELERTAGGAVALRVIEVEIEEDFGQAATYRESLG